jgi:surfactin family lipopeptide synthetase A
MTNSPYALSHPQKRLWALDQLEPGSAAYNIAGALRIAGCLRTGPFWSALHAVVRRHESLRTTFAIVDGEPRQFVRDLAPATDELDLSREHDGEAAAIRILRADASAPFDLACGPLVRAKVLKLADDDWIFYLNLHHIIGDEWSLGVILRDLVAAYGGVSLSPLPIQYRDAAARQNAWTRSAEAERDRQYWKEKLAGPLPLLDLPSDDPRPAEVTHNGANLSVTLDAGLSTALRSLGRSAEATLFQTLTALTKLLLHRYTGSEDIVIGVPVAGRDDADLEEQAGFYVNMLVLRDRVRGEESFLDLLASVRDTALEAHEHARYPFDLLVNELDVERDLGRSPLFDVAVILQDRDGEPPPGALRMKSFDFGFVTAKYDLSFYFADAPDGIEVVLNYNTDLFRSETMARMAAHFEQLARGVVRDPRVPIAEIEMVTEQERRQLIEELNATSARYPGETIVELFEEQAARTPEKVAVIAGSETLTYRELNERANGIANMLDREKPLVAVLLEPSEWTVASLLGVLKAGCAYVPLDPIYPPERLRFMLEDSGARTLLTEPACEALAREIAVPPVRVENVRDAVSVSANPTVAHNLDHLAYVIYTSGSTGVPKGCCITQRNVVRLLKNDRFPFDFGADDVWIVAHSFCFDFSVWEMYGALLHGGSLVVPRREEVRDVDLFLALLKRHRVTILNQTPAAFYNLAEREEHELDEHLRCVIFGGDRLDPARLRGWVARHPLDRVALVNMFGITETTVHVTICRLRDEDISADAGRSPVGVPLPETTVYVMNASRKLQPLGVAGELYVGGSGVGRGYLNRDDLTTQRFVRNPYRPNERLYRSGDVGRWTHDLTLDHLGRNDDQVQIRGFRVELREVERALLSIDGIRKTIVLARDNGGGVKELVAWIAGDFDAAELRVTLRRTLPDYMVPAHFVSIDDLPLTSNNKIDVSALPPPGASRPAGPQHVAPRDRLERSLAAIWERVLGVTSLSIHDNYFNAGGDSIKVIRLIGAIGAELGVRLEVRDVFRHTTIADLATYMRGSLPQDDELSAASAAIEALTQAILDDPRERQLLPDGWEDFYPMSDIEQGMIFHNLLDSAGGVYHDQFLYPIAHEPFDEAAFRQALQLLVAKHPILRTSFHIEGFREPLQVVHSERPFALPVEDLSQLDESTLLRVFDDDRAVPFDVTQPGLWRARLARLSGGAHALLWSVHHAILDGWSNASFFAELMATYTAVIGNPDLHIAPLRASVRDFVVDQRRWRRSEDVEAFWRRELDGYERMGAPFGRALDAARAAGTRRQLTRSIDPATGSALLALARRENVPIRDVYLAAFATLSEIVTGKNDLLFGVVTNNRPAVADGDAILGCFLNSIPFRVTLPFPRTPRDILRATVAKSQQLAAYERLSMRRIAEIAGAAGEQAPFFDVLFNFVDFHVLEERDDHPLLVHESTNTLFDFSVSGTRGNFSATIAYLDGLFTDAEVERIAGWYTRILDAFASADGELLTHATIAGDDQAFNQTARDYPRDATIAAIFDEQARRTPDAEAVASLSSSSLRTLTYRELNARANGLAHALRAQGIAAEECVAVLTERSERTVIAFLGILKAGGAYVPIDPDWPQERIDFVLRDTGCRIVLDDGAIEKMACERDDDLPPIGDGSSLAYVNYTSGSTGKPKGSLIEQHSVLRLVRNTNYVDLSADDRIVQAGSVAFDACTFEIWGALLNGGCVVVPERGVLLDAARFARLLEDERITILFLTTSVFNQFADADATMFRRLRVLLTGGEKASPRHFVIVREACPDLDLQHVYGPTENTTFSTFHRVTQVDDDVPIGAPIANSTVHILDRNLQPLPPGVPGEICTGGDGVARGYLNDPELTARKFVHDPFRDDGGRLYRTGDLGRRRSDGAIEFIGRADRQVKVRGFRVEPGEIEQQLLAHPAVAQAVVLTRSTPAGTVELLAYFTARTPLDAQELREHLGRFLPPYMVPAHLILLEAMPLAPTGKIDRRALPSPDDAIAPSGAPRDDREELLANIWSEVLGRGRVGIDDNYFQLGGDSIRAIQVNSRLKRAGWRMEIRDLFATPTIAELAPKLRRAEGGAVQTPSSGRAPLTPIQHWLFREHRGPLHHFMQPILFRSRLRLDEQRLRDALQAIWEHHDQLRAVFQDKDAQIVRPPDSAVSFEVAGAIRPHAEQLLASIDLANGPLFKAVLYRLDDGDRLLLAAHHLVVDAVSWRIIIEDLERAYGGAPLPPRTHSFGEWARHLERYARSEEARGEIEHWSSFAADTNDDAVNLYGDCHSVEMALSPGETTQLLSGANAAFDASVNDVLLTAFARALRLWRGNDSLQIMIERHGRLPLEPGLDVSRTIGWFTSISPFLLQLRGRDLPAQIANVKRALEAVPHGGIGYGVLRYLSSSIFNVGHPRPRIAFNYLGQFDAGESQTMFRIADESLGRAVGAEVTRQNDIDVDSMVSGGALRFGITYDVLRHNAKDIGTLASLFHGELSDAARHCTATPAFSGVAANDYDAIVRSMR